MSKRLISSMTALSDRHQQKAGAGARCRSKGKEMAYQQSSICTCEGEADARLMCKPAGDFHSCSSCSPEADRSRTAEDVTCTIWSGTTLPHNNVCTRIHTQQSLMPRLANAMLVLQGGEVIVQTDSLSSSSSVKLKLPLE